MHGAHKHAWRTQAGWAKRFHIIAGFRQGGANIMFPFYWNTESLRMSPNTMSKIKLKNFKYVIHTKASNFRSVALSDKFCFLLFHPWGDGALQRKWRRMCSQLQFCHRSNLIVLQLYCDGINNCYFVGMYYVQLELIMIEYIKSL